MPWSAASEAESEFQLFMVPSALLPALGGPLLWFSVSSSVPEYLLGYRWRDRHRIEEAQEVKECCSPLHDDALESTNITKQVKVCVDIPEVVRHLIIIEDKDLSKWVFVEPLSLCVDRPIYTICCCLKLVKASRIKDIVSKLKVLSSYFEIVNPLILFKSLVIDIFLPFQWQITIEGTRDIVKSGERIYNIGWYFELFNRFRWLAVLLLCTRS